MVKEEDMLIAFEDCLHGKAQTLNAAMFCTEYLTNVAELTNLVNDRTYYPITSICFVVPVPKPREVFAADFRDRVIHHYVIMKLNPLFELVFSPRTFNCRKGKGQLYGVEMLKEDVRVMSENYTKDCYISRYDLQGFFMSIQKSIVADIVDKFIVDYYFEEDKEDLRWLCQVLISHSPELDCVRQSSPEAWDALAWNKSLFTCGEGRGLAIGNLFVQIFANFLLNDLDWEIDYLGFPHHGRYVDDFYIVSRTKEEVLAIVPLLRQKLAERGLTLHPDKFFMQHYSKGMMFTGFVVKRDRVYLSNRTVSHFYRAVLRFNKAKTLEEVRSGVQSLNSFLGLLKHADSYAIRREYLSMIDSRMYEFIYIKGHFEVVKLKKKYYEENIIKERIKSGAYYSAPMLDYTYTYSVQGAA